MRTREFSWAERTRAVTDMPWVVDLRRTGKKRTDEG
jgi:hypothetical protein